MTHALRDARPSEDRPHVIRLFRALQAEERAMEPNRAPPEHTDPHVDALLEWAATGGLVLLAEAPDSREPVGLLIAGLQDDGPWVLPENRPHAYVSDLYVAPDHRRRGLARAFLETAGRRFAAQGIRRIEISTLAANAPARALYESWTGAPAEVLAYAKRL
jgi:ribosomal protein S18 acetylase RimI-like enzyme